jgi:hypothetical protein
VFTQQSSELVTLRATAEGRNGQQNRGRGFSVCHAGQAGGFFGDPRLQGLQFCARRPMLSAMSYACDEQLRQDRAPRPGREELLAPKTQIVADREAYLGQGRNDVGRRISDDQVELFITADVAGSLQKEFALHDPDFIAVHDVGSSASLRLISSLASAAGSRVQRLSVRRQGHGVALAVLQFVEVPLADGSQVRAYSTDLNADSQTRLHVARVLLAYSRLGVLLVGELPAHAVTGQLAPLHEALMRGPWPNRHLLMVPLRSSTDLAALATQLAGRSEVAVHVTPAAQRQKQAWALIGGAWNQLHSRHGGERALQTELALAVARPRVPTSEAVTSPMKLNPRAAASVRAQLPSSTARPSAPTLQAETPVQVAGSGSWQAYADRCSLIKGTLSCCVFDLRSGTPLAHAGGQPPADRMAQQGSLLLGQMTEIARAMGLGGGQVEATLSTISHHLLLRPVPRHPGIAVHLVLLASTGNLTLARMHLQRIDSAQ